MAKFKKVGKRIGINLSMAFALWVVIVFIIQLISPNPLIYTMPENCTLNSGNCVRVDDNGTSYRNNYLITPIINGSSLEVIDVISELIINERGGKILFYNEDTNNHTYFLHAKDLTQFFFFPDDLFIQSKCTDDGKNTVVILQSQSRLGKGDLGVNFERLSEIILYLENYSWSGDNCTN